MIAPVAVQATRDRHSVRLGLPPLRMLGSPRSHVLIAGGLAAFAVLLTAATAGARPSCFGHKATIVGNHRGNHIKGTPHADVIAGKGGRDKILGNGGRDIICGGGGPDRLLGGNQPNRLHRDKRTTLIGGPGNDKIHGSFASDFIVGDKASIGGNAIGGVGRDHLDGDFGNDHIVGDNFSRHNAKGGKHDWLSGQKGNDAMIGDSQVTGSGTARGGGNDHFVSASDDDFEVGDSYSPAGKAAGGGKDELNAGPQRDFIVGDSYTKTGVAIGAGRDQIHSRPGPDVAHGDNYAAAPQGRVRGGKHDFIGGAGGIDHLFGGPGRDTCNGGRGHHDTARQCEFVLEVP
jgi:Ca2+-binding RTX toxin-like protein